MFRRSVACLSSYRSSAVSDFERLLELVDAFCTSFRDETVPLRSIGLGGWNSKNRGMLKMTESKIDAGIRYPPSLPPQDWHFNAR